MNRDYLETWAWKIGFYDDGMIKPVSERIDVEAAIQRSLDEREALYMRLNGIRSNIADYWLLPEAQQRKVRAEIGMRK